MKNILLLATWTIVMVIINYALTVTVSCPSLTWNTLTNNACFQHSATNPVTSISLTSCSSGDVCPLEDGQYAWIKAELQQYTSGTTSQSQIYQRQTYLECVGEEAFFSSSLNNGRKCIQDSDCLSRNCEDSTWVNKEKGDPCAVHSDWNKQLAWRQSFIWPYESTWQTWSSSGSDCIDDFDCAPTDFWWYMTAADVGTNTTKWMTKFSADDGVEFGWVSRFNDNLEDAIYNGQFWSGAWAYMSTTNTAKCFSIQQITDQSNNVLSSPYQCDPTETDNKCRYYADSTNYVEVGCEWGFNNDGYCPKPGAADTANYVTNMKYVFGNSTCHTLDKNNLSAQTEWGIGNNDDWNNAVNFRFIFEYYPFIQNSTYEACLKSVFPDSIENIAGAWAFIFKLAWAAYGVLAIVYALF